MTGITGFGSTGPTGVMGPPGPFVQTEVLGPNAIEAGNTGSIQYVNEVEYI